MSPLVVPTVHHSPNSGTYVPTILKRVEFGVGSLSKLAEILQELSISKPFIVTGNSLATKTSVIEQVTNAAATGIGSVFTEIKQHAPYADITNAIEELKSSQSDGIIAVGGGSPIDAAKVIVAIYKEATGKLLKLVSIPTTLSAAEFTISAGYSSIEGKKMSKRSSEIGSTVIILDANLSLNTPNRLWLSTGIRALDHCVEQQYRPNTAIPIRVLAREGAGTLFESLRACHRNPTDVDARQRAMIGVWMSLWSNETTSGPVGPSHSIGHQIGSPYSVPHGICSCLTLARVVKIQSKHLPDDDVKQLASLLPFITDSNEPFADSREAVVKLGETIEQFVDDLGLTSTLREYNVPPADFEGIIERAIPNGKLDERFNDFVELLRSIY